MVDNVLSGEKINPSAPSTNYYANFRITYGTVVDLSSDMMLLRVDKVGEESTTSYLQATPLSTLKRIYDFDTDSSNSRSVVVSTAKSSFKAEKDFGVDASKVLFIYDYGKPIVAVIYR